ncbi:hypothetical protein [Streptomyces sp. NPDC002851]
MRIARALATTALATALASAAVAGTAPAAFAQDAAASVSPRTVRPGGTVTVTVSCPMAGGQAPATITANSQAFQAGSVRLHRSDDPGIPEAARYHGTARIAPAGNFTNTGPNAVGPTSEWGVDGTCPDGTQWNASFTVTTATVPTTAPTPGAGVRGGFGGSITDSGVPAAIGTVLVASALGGTYVVLRRRRAAARG